MTIRLYDKDVDTLDFSAVVKTCVQRENGYVVTLDQTAFFPEGGGQGADHGTLGGVQVLDAHDVHGEVEHLVSTPLTIGSEVRGHVDAARRLDMMQQHSGEHMFSGLVHGLFGYDNVGFHIGTEAVTMDFNGMLTEEDVRRVELLANQAVWRDQPVEAFVPDREALANIEYRSKKEIDGDVRIVRIEGVDTCACCGTHVHTTGAVGQIKVVGVQKYKSGVRVSILCGRRALAYENAMLDQAKGRRSRTFRADGGAFRRGGADARRARPPARTERRAGHAHFRSAGAAGGKKRDPRRGLRRAARRARA